MSPRLEIFENGLKEAERVYAQYPHMFPLQTIIDQLVYLIDVEKNKASPDKLSSINLGQIAARDIEDLDEKLAKLLHKISSEVRTM